MAYTDTGGNGVPLVFLHGTGCDDVYWAGICGLLCSRLTGMVSSRLFGCAGRFLALLPLFRPFVIQRSRRWLCFSPWPGRGALCPPQFEECLGTAPYLRVSANPGTIRPGSPSNHHQLQFFHSTVVVFLMFLRHQHRSPGLRTKL